MYIFDIHSHILPGLDDGAQNEAESLKMLQMAYEQGVKKIVATPHWSRRYHHYSLRQVDAMCYALECRAKEEGVVGPEFCIYPGQEFFYSEEMAEKLENGETLRMAGSRFILAEFFPGVSWSVLFGGVRRLSMLSYQPIIAHIERYPVLREGERVEELIDAGAMLQMNYGSIDGAWYEKDSKWCHKMLKNGYVHFMGTDMHNTTSRKPRIDDAVRWLTNHLEQEYVEDICFKNAERMSANQRI